jgi:hypothetical protein
MGSTHTARDKASTSRSVFQGSVDVKVGELKLALHIHKFC